MPLNRVDFYLSSIVPHFVPHFVPRLFRPPRPRPPRRRSTLSRRHPRRWTDVRSLARARDVPKSRSSPVERVLPSARYQAGHPRPSSLVPTPLRPLALPTLPTLLRLSLARTHMSTSIYWYVRPPSLIYAVGTSPESRLALADDLHRYRDRRISSLSSPPAPRGRLNTPRFNVIFISVSHRIKYRQEICSRRSAPPRSSRPRRRIAPAGLWLPRPLARPGTPVRYIL